MSRCANRLRAPIDPTAPRAAAFLALLREVLAGRRQHFELDYPCHSPDQPRWFVVRVSRMAGPGPVRIVVATTTSPR